ncbi:hypothetical protein HU200_056595 [Digitaria exilis]|uniref:Uncharacterized protein n=1 Tax=Digitaria exilis TaxID=1010633 RepID=A0A835E3N7_9POAL|nr:hypothetical protein HU200_056595 [Digitaria exilis]
MEVFTIAAWQIWKQRNALIFENKQVSANRWKRDFVIQCHNQAHRSPSKHPFSIGLIPFLYSYLIFISSLKFLSV